MRSAIFVILVVASSLSVAAEPIQSFAAAKEIWKQTNKRTEYKAYVEQSLKTINEYNVEEKHRCFSLSKEPLELMLVITHQSSSNYASVANVLSSSESAKAKCFQQSFMGARLGIPPFLPLVFQMGIE